MSLKIENRFPGANCRIMAVQSGADAAQVSFAADPQGGPESLWFCFRVVETEPDGAHPQKLNLTMKFFNSILGADHPEACRPVYQPDGQGWYRANTGQVNISKDGRVEVTWTIPYPSPATLVALCFPYGRTELDRLVKRCKRYWQRDDIGLTQGGRVIERLSNDYGRTRNAMSGVYVIARQHAGETPGSWVLDGMLERFARDKKLSCMVWATPFADVDGVVRGDYGKDGYPYDLNRAWGEQPRRHEIAVIQRDMQAWKERCTPRLAIDLHAPGGTDSDGIYAFVPDPDKYPKQHERACGWGKVMAQGLGKEYAAEDFLRVARHPSRWDTPRFGDYARDTLGVDGITLEVPYAICRETIMNQKSYRDAGRLIAKAILDRLH